MSWFFGKPNNERFRVDVIDTWNMTITHTTRSTRKTMRLRFRGNRTLQFEYAVQSDLQN